MLGEHVNIVSGEKSRPQNTILKNNPDYGICTCLEKSTGGKYIRMLSNIFKRWDYGGFWFLFYIFRSITSILKWASITPIVGGKMNITLSPQRNQGLDTGWGWGRQRLACERIERFRGSVEETRKLKLGESYLPLAEAEGTCWRQAAQKIPRELLGTGLLSLVTSTSRARLHENLSDQRCNSQAPPSFFLPFIKYPFRSEHYARYLPCAT